MQWAISKKKPFFIGKRTLDELNNKPLTRKLAGFAISDAPAQPKESHLLIAAGEMIGRVTSACYSEALGMTIGLAYVPPGMSEPGMSMDIRCDAGVMVRAEIVEAPFYDAAGERQSL